MSSHLHSHSSHSSVPHISAFLSSLHSQTEEQALAELLAHLPLLNPGSTEARGEYMKLLPKVMLGSSDELNYLDQCRQLLSLALVHPAFPQEDREALTFWLSQLDRKQKNIVDRIPPSPSQPARVYQIKSVPEEVSWSCSNGSPGGRIDISGKLNIDNGDVFSESSAPQDEDEVLSRTATMERSSGAVNGGAMCPNSLDESGESTLHIEWKEGMKGRQPIQ